MNKKFGFVSLTGRTNVGKSTLLNSIFQKKIAITSRKPQTTRNRILGIFSDEKNQIVFLDSPGVHSGHRRALNKYMNNSVAFINIGEPRFEKMGNHNHKYLYEKLPYMIYGKYLHNYIGYNPNGWWKYINIKKDQLLYK